MTKDVLLARIAAIVTTLEETNGSPESMLYIFSDMLWLLACQINTSNESKSQNSKHQDYELIRDVLVKAGYVTIKGNYVTLTEAGKETAAKLNAVIGV